MQNKDLSTEYLESHITFSPEVLLGRPPIALDPVHIHSQVKDSIILITGAAGSIGSELAMQICTYNPAAIILVDQAETALNTLDIYLKQRFPHVAIKAFLANITDVSRMKLIFRHNVPDIVFHAAAYKHVPFMEKQPYEAIKTNIFGVETLARLSLTFKVRKFIFISTDKAVNPASIMGATKRVAEMYLQHLSKIKPEHTQFITTRFGNVLGSSGSFFLIFEQQIRTGGPITVTHPKMSRYIMTASEACQLVLEASATGENGQILFFDMGKPVLIEDIALRMIALSQPAREIKIEYTGLRPGEKLNEELSDDREEVTEHAKMRVCRPVNPVIHVQTMLGLLKKALDSGDDERMIAALKMAVPVFKPLKDLM